MDYKLLIVFYLLCGPLTASESPVSPRELECMFFAFTNVTCHWTPAVNAQPDTHYTLQVNLTGWKSMQCQSSQPRCSVPVKSLNRIYCIQVFANSVHHPLVVSDMLCLNGTDAVKLPEPVDFGLTTENGRPRCLRVNWYTPRNFPLPESKIHDGYLLYQLQYSTPDQPAPLTLDVDLREEVQCVFLPCTQYSIRMRYRYKHTLSHWSDWSHTATKRTEAEAPSSIPQLWRTVQAADVEGFRRVTLLWKAPLQIQAACTAVWFNVQCRLEDSLAAVDLGDCSNLSLVNSLCHLTVPPQTCICTLNMSNSAGSSPPATITIPRQWQMDQTSLVSLLVTSLGNSSLEVQWEALEFPIITGFVVEWCVTAESSQCQNKPQWQRVEQNTRKTIITEGLKPSICYSVSVKAVYGTMSSPGLVVLAYSRQAAPSAGPKLHVAKQSCSYVLLTWSPVPLLRRQGFITKYSLYYKSNNSTGELLISGDSEQYVLSGVSGLFRLYMKAHTAAGAGPPGPEIVVPIDSCVPLQTTLLSGCVFIAVFSVLLCLCWRIKQRIKQNIWPKVPNPANSSLSDWL